MILSASDNTCWSEKRVIGRVFLADSGKYFFATCVLLAHRCNVFKSDCENVLDQMFALVKKNGCTRHEHISLVRIMWTAANRPILGEHLHLFISEANMLRSS